MEVSITILSRLMVVSCEANCKKTSMHAHHQAYMCDQYSEFLHTLKAFDKQQVDDRIKETLTLEDMDVLVELQHQNEGHAAQYDMLSGQNVLSIHQNAQLCMKGNMGTLVTWLQLFLLVI